MTIFSVSSPMTFRSAWKGERKDTIFSRPFWSGTSKGPFYLGLTKSRNHLLPTFKVDKTCTLVAGQAVDDPATVDHCAGGGTFLHTEDLEVLHGLVNIHCIALWRQVHVLSSIGRKKSWKSQALRCHIPNRTEKYRHFCKASSRALTASRKGLTASKSGFTVSRSGWTTSKKGYVESRWRCTECI